jgi:hypothetical protein
VGTGLRDVPTIEQSMHTHLLYVHEVALIEHSKQMIDVAVHVSVRQKTDEVHCLSVLFGPRYYLLPALTFEQGAIFESSIDQLGALVENSTGTQSIVPDLAVTHVSI